MSEKNKIEESSSAAIAVALRLAFIALLLVLSFKILTPFIMPIVWGIIISVGIYPLFLKLTHVLHDKPTIASTIFVVLGIAILVVPFAFLISSTASSIELFVNNLNEDTFKIPPPPAYIENWPLIGDWLFDLWKKSSENLEVLVDKMKPYLTTVLPTIFSSAAGVIGTIFQFVFSVIIAGLLLVHAKKGKQVAVNTFKTIIGKEGEGFVEISIGTIRGVVQGVLGTAIIQTIFIGIGFFVMGIPGAGILTVLVLLVAIMQVPPTLVTVPVVIYVFGVENTTPAVIFSIWVIVWSASDNLLKPILMGRGVDIPMLVILLGSIGGMVAFGIIGLFVGAVILAITYKVMLAWGKTHASE